MFTFGKAFFTSDNDQVNSTGKDYVNMEPV